MTTTTANLIRFGTMEALIDAYAMTLETDMTVARRVARDTMTYAPHISNAGYFIRGFGYSVERLTRLNNSHVVLNLDGMN